MARSVILRGSESIPGDLSLPHDSWWTAAGKINDMMADLYALQSDIVSAGDVRFATAGTTEQIIEAAAVQAELELATILFIPANFIPYDTTQVGAHPTLRRVREGGDFSIYDPLAYGAAGDNSRSDHANVQACINAAAGIGTVVLTRLFRCSSMLQLPSSTEIVGLGWQTGLRFDWVLQSVGEVYVINQDNLTTGNTNIRLRDFTIQGAHPGGPLGNPTPAQCGGLLFRYGNSVELRSLQIHHVPAISVSHQGIAQFVAVGNYIHDGGRDGITGGPNDAWPSTDVVIQGNTISVHDDHIACNQSVDQAHPGITSPTRWTIAGNLCTGGPSLSADNFARGILLSGAIDCVVENNQIQETNQPGILVIADVVTAIRCLRIKLLGNTVRHAGAVGTDRGQSRIGMQVDGADDFQLQNNSVTACKENGISIRNATFFQVQHNLVQGNGNGAGTDSVGLYLNGNSTTTVDGLVTGNLCQENLAAGIFAAECSRITLGTNRCINNGQEGTNDTLHTGITLEGTTVAGIYQVQGNVCVDTQVNKTQSYGLTIRGAQALAYVALFDNFLATNEVASILINTTPTSFPRRNNQLTTGAVFGRTALTNGTATVNTTEVLAADNIVLSRVVGAGTTRGMLSVGTIVASTSFVINSTDLSGTLSADDDSTVFWEIVH